MGEGGRRAPEGRPFFFFFFFFFFFWGVLGQFAGVASVASAAMSRRGWRSGGSDSMTAGWWNTRDVAQCQHPPPP